VIRQRFKQALAFLVIGGFVLLEADGSVARLDARAVLATARRSYGGTMPPKKSSVAPLTDAEVAEVMAWLDTQK
jgi:hypothetical protein